jgi:hypothetical protein
MARPRKELENMEFNGWDQLDSLIMWASAEYCAEKLGLSADSLSTRIKERHAMGFSEYKNKRKETLRINLLKKQYDVAMAGNVSMLIWLGKNELGQKDKIEQTNISDTLTEDLIKEAQDILAKVGK